MAEPPFLSWTPTLSWWPMDPPMGMSPCSPVDSELVPLPMCGLGWGGGTHLGVRILLGGGHRTSPVSPVLNGLFSWMATVSRCFFSNPDPKGSLPLAPPSQDTWILWLQAGFFGL